MNFDVSPYFDLPFINLCNMISLPFNSLGSQLSFDVLCFRMDHIVNVI